ncbi:hypothetical protein SY83_02185 [Paenibacillus swuensis]|uniref:Alpha-L-rhamnosidase n=1 Tax=Paenibacillus swuensis TaxID=1178515 RepID=A0A172TEH3_9BACL|nr:alpha-L-rhamnosidase N-terminal domain-containing protein [Paenibacillus swuensis]ANE45336.1 hypothetical protein SY83_02185 [Paenibacillus swuensis]
MNPEASWIWHESLSTLTNSYVDFRKTFQLSTVNDAKLHISASQEYLLCVNGHLIGRGPSPCSPEWQYYDSYDVTEFLQPGSNCITVVGYRFGEKDIVIEQMQGEAGLIVSLDMAGNPLVTDTSWKCRISPRYETRTMRISRWGGFNEIYAAEREDGWEQPEYDDSAWAPAVIAAAANDPDGPWPRLLAREIPFLHKEWVSPKLVVRMERNYGRLDAVQVASDEFAVAFPIRIDASVPGSLPGIVYDFATEVVGRPELRMDAPEGGVVRLAYGESLELQYVDTFLLKKGLNVLQPYGRRACRYVQLTLMATPQPVDLLMFRFENQHYDFPEAGTFRTSDPMLDRIWDISQITTVMNSQDHLEDCPWREKALWVADAVVMGKVIYHMYGDTKLLRKCLLQGARIQQEEGWIPGTGPETNKMLLPDFNGHWLIGVYEYYMYTQDRAFLEQIWTNLVRVVEWFDAQADDTGLFANAARPGFFCFIDWTEHLDRRDKVTAISCIYYKALQCMVPLAEALGLTDYSEELRIKAEALQLAIRTNLWIEEKGAYADCMDGNQLSEHVSLQTNFLAIWANLMTEEEADRFLTDYYNTGKAAEVKGAFFQHIVLEVFLKLNRRKQAAGLIRNYWGGMVARGAVTWWETYDHASSFCVTPSTYQGNVPTYLWEEPRVSMCHGWGASPGYILYQLILGVNIMEQGHGRLKITVPFQTVQWAEGRLPTKDGWVDIKWKENGGILEGLLRYPDSMELVLEEGYPERIRIESYPVQDKLVQA